MKKPAAGRPRDETSRKAILAATFKLLQKRGYARLPLQLIATTAGVGKTTIYRWWPNRAALAMDAFFEYTAAELAFPDSASAADDFRQQIKQLATVLRSKRGEVLAAMIVGSRNDRDLARALQTQWIDPRRVWGFARITRAAREGQCVPNLNIPSALDALYSPLYAHLFLGVGVHTEDEVDRHCDFLFPLIFLPDA